MRVDKQHLGDFRRSTANTTKSEAVRKVLQAQPVEGMGGRTGT